MSVRLLGNGDAPLSEPSAESYKRWRPDPADITFKLAGTLAQEGDFVGARRAYEIASQTGPPELASRAMYLCGVVLSASGDDTAALEAFREAADYGYRQAASWAHYRIGEILERQKDYGNARDAFRQADALGHAEAPILLAGYMRAENDGLGREADLRRADKRGSATAAYQLGSIYLDRPGAESKQQGLNAIRRADERGYELATIWLGLEEDKAGRREAAISHYKRAEARGSDLAAIVLGITYEQLGMDQQAFDAYYRAASGSGSHAPLAALKGGHLLFRHRRFAEAEQWYRQAAMSDNPDWVREAMTGIGQTGCALGDLASGFALLKFAYAGGDRGAVTALAQGVLSLRPEGIGTNYDRQWSDFQHSLDNLVLGCRSNDPTVSRLSAETRVAMQTECCGKRGHPRGSTTPSYQDADSCQCLCGARWDAVQQPDRVIAGTPWGGSKEILGDVAWVMRPTPSPDDFIAGSRAKPKKWAVATAAEVRQHFTLHSHHAGGLR